GLLAQSRRRVARLDHRDGWRRTICIAATIGGCARGTDKRLWLRIADRPALGWDRPGIQALKRKWRASGGSKPVYTQFRALVFCQKQPGELSELFFRFQRQTFSRDFPRVCW